MTDIVVLINDLIFETRIRAAAADAGLTSAFAKNAAGLAKQLGAEDPRLVLVDVNSGLEAVGALRDAVGHPSKPRVLAFVSHVERELVAAAREAGAEVLPRSAFVQRLPEILRDIAKP